MTARLWARVDVPGDARAALPYHAWTLRPDGTRDPMPPPAVLVIEVRPDGVFLVGYAIDGSFAGDTWHRDVQEACDQADFALGPFLGQWTPVPPDVDDVVAYVLAESRPDESLPPGRLDLSLRFSPGELAGRGLVDLTLRAMPEARPAARFSLPLQR